MLWSYNKLVIIVFITVMGISRCFIMTLIQVVVADAVEPEKFSSAIGLVFLLFGFFNLAVGPIVGEIFYLFIYNYCCYLLYCKKKL